MRQEKLMQDLEHPPLIVKPPVYILHGISWQWCLLKDLCQTVKGIADALDFGFHPTPEQIVSRFAALTRKNKGLETKSHGKKRPPVKIFRFSVNGKGFQGTRVPINLPWKKNADALFTLNIPKPYPTELFVPEGWALDVLKAVQKRTIAVCSPDDEFVYLKALKGPALKGFFVPSLDCDIEPR